MLAVEPIENAPRCDVELAIAGALQFRRARSQLGIELEMFDHLENPFH